nr:hypothetical protein Ccrd_009960 [Ipomoea trifida]
MSSAFLMWLSKKMADSLPFTSILNLIRHIPQKRMSTVLKIIGLGYNNEADGDAYGDDGYNYAPATCLEGDGDDDDGDYDYAPAA